MRRLYVVIIAAISFMVLFPACAGKKNSAEKSGVIQVVTTIFPPYDFVRAIAGDRAGLSMLLPPGAESHSFEPAPRDIITVQHCDVFIYTGGESDTWASRILESMDTSKMQIIRMMDAVDVVEEEIVEGMEEAAEEEEGAAYDEHVWTSPKNAIRIVRAIAGVLCEVDSADAALFRRNEQAFIESLDGLDREFQALVDGAKRKTIVFGDRFPFRYFADAYGLEYFAAFPGCSTETECSVATLAFLIDKIKAEKIPVVFHIELSNEKMADTIAGETGARKLLLHACHNIAKRDFDSGVTFLELQKANVPGLREALW
jgi:zinc transport system substrate-binding protein